MRQIRTTLPALAALLLAACQQPASNSDIAVDNGVNAAATDVETLPPDESVDDNAAAPANQAAPASLPTHIPEQFQGRWGLNAADCTPTRGDAKGLLTISDARLTFYESKGTLDKVLGATANSFDASYGFIGEGQTWQRVERLTRTNGKLQRRTDAAPGQEPPVNLTYTRCGEWR